MKIAISVDTENPGDLSNAYKVLNALKGSAAAPQDAQGGNQGTLNVPPQPPAPAAPPAPTPAAAPAPPPVAPPPAPVAAAPGIQAMPPPAPAPAAAAAPPPPPAPVPAADNSARTAFAQLVQEYAKVYTPKGTKARFASLAAHYQQPTWTSQSAIPDNMLAEVSAWFKPQA